ncbi:hypothetical protein RQP46_001927 [Phenoliferia psychrophenolica]
MSLNTPLCKMFGIKHPVLLAGMNVAAGPDLAAAVTNAGGMGVIGGFGYTPKHLRAQIKELKDALVDKSAPFGVDLLLPSVGGSARKTNKDYTGGKLEELVKIIIEEKTALFVCAVGVPPAWVVDEFHKAGIPVANMVGAPKHCAKALERGVDIIIPQGSEGGGHTGDVPTAILIPACVEAVAGKKSPLTGGPILVIGAGGIHNGKGLAAALAGGAVGAWVGTRFVCAEEAGASKYHQDQIIATDHSGTIRTLIYTGRPLRVKKTEYVMDWENNRQAEIESLTKSGKLPIETETKDREDIHPLLMGNVAAMIHSVEPAKKIIDDMIRGAMRVVQTDVFLVGSGPASCTYARTLLDSTDKHLFMAEMGSQQSSILGENLKNAAYFQKNIAAFQHVIVGHLHELEPNNTSLPGASATYAVGGMASHWTCATPRPHEDELPDTYTATEWNRLYTAGEQLLGTNLTPFDGLVSQQIISRALTNHFGDSREIKGLPLAVKTSPKWPHLKWSGCDTIMKEQFYSERLTLKSDTHVRKLLHLNGRVTYALCFDLVSGEEYLVEAKTFVVGAGAILSPQLLFASGIGGDNVGRYLTDHPTAFCQVSFPFPLYIKYRAFDGILAAHRQAHPGDNVPIPFDDPDPQLYTPYTRETPFHTQIHREAFHYGGVADRLDQRLVVHLRWYTKQDPRAENRVSFNPAKLDIWGLPSPSFQCTLSKDDAERNELSMADMKKFATVLGEYLPGVEPHWRPYGQALHACGTTRIGRDPSTSVVDPTSRVHGFSNLWVGGNNVIPTANSVNPTLTTVAYAIKGAEEMIRIMGWGVVRREAHI